MNSYLEIEISWEEFNILQQLIAGVDYLNANILRYPGFVADYLLLDRNLDCMVTLTDLGKKCSIQRIRNGFYTVRIPVVDKRAC